MKQILFIGIAAILSGCSSLYMGLGVHPRGADAPEIQLDNPIGIFGGEMELVSKDRLHVISFFDHYSGLFQMESGIGFNVTGIKAKVDLTNR